MEVRDSIGALRTRKYNSVQIDWLRIRVPYPYKESSRTYGAFKSHAGNPITSVYVNENDVKVLLDRAFSLIIGRHWLHLPTRKFDYYKQNWVVGDGVDGYDFQFNHLNRNINYNTFGNIAENRAKMGLMIEFTGQGCREMEHILDYCGKSWNDFFVDCKHYFPKSKCTRIDVNYNLKGGSERILKHVTPRGMNRLFQAHKVITASRYTSLITTHRPQIRDNSNWYLDIGSTFYIGHKSDMLLRIYDKQKERKYSHGNSNLDPNFYWIRWEFENKSTYANQIYGYLVDGSSLNAIFQHLLVYKLRVVNWVNTKNVSRSKTADWWHCFVASVSTATYKSDKIAKWFRSGNSNKLANAYSTVDWLNDSVSKTFIMSLLAIYFSGGNVRVWLEHFVHEGKAKLFRDKNTSIKQIKQFIRTMHPKLGNGKVSDEVLLAVLHNIRPDEYLDDYSLLHNYKKSDRLGKYAE